MCLIATGKGSTCYDRSMLCPARVPIAVCICQLVMSETTKTKSGNRIDYAADKNVLLLAGYVKRILESITHFGSSAHNTILSKLRTNKLDIRPTAYKECLFDILLGGKAAAPFQYPIASYSYPSLITGTSMRSPLGWCFSSCLACLKLLACSISTLSKG